MNDRTFKDTWERTRVDFASTQHSPSEYDMSIANQMIATGWAEQEVFWTIVLWREKHSEDLDKVLKRTDYIELTFAKAKKGNVVSVAVRNIADITATVQQLQAVEPDSLDKQEEIDAQIEHNRQRAFEEVSSLIGTTLTGFHREGVGKGCNYYLQFGQKKVLVGEVDDLFNIKNVRHCIYNEADIVVGKIKDVDWWGAMQLLTSFRTEKMNPSLSPTYRWMTFLLNYVERAPVIPDKKHDAEKEGKERRHTALMRSKPYWQTYQENGTADSTYRKLFFHLESLRNHAQKYYGDRTPHNDVVDAIHALGVIPEHVNHMHKGKRIHRYLWAIPASEIAKHTAFVQKETTKDDTTNETRETTEPDN